ncbi:Ankyrin repeat and protein kinase domain-containing protein 1, partial [Tetrabaena socialis]
MCAHVHPLFCKQEGRAPLHKAVVGGYKEAVEVMVSVGADLDVKDKAGATPLHIASQSSSVEMAEMLLRAGADADAKDKKLATPLHVASLHGRSVIAEALLQAGADVGAKDKAGADVGAKTKVGRARWSSSKARDVNKDMLGLRAWGVELSPPNPASMPCAFCGSQEGWSPLHVASWKGQSEVVTVLLKAGADPHAQQK